MSRLTICINAKDINIDKFDISEQKEIKTKNNIKMKIAEIGYMNDNNEICDLYIILPTVETFGPHPQYIFGSTKTLENINGYTIAYSNKDISKLFKTISKLCSKQFKKCNIKPVFVKNKDDKEIAYLKLKMIGDKIATMFYSDKMCRKSINGLDLVSKFGTLTPMIHLRSIYFGAHGTLEYNASFQLNIVKAVFQEKLSSLPNFTFEEEEEEE